MKPRELQILLAVLASFALCAVSVIVFFAVAPSRPESVDLPASNTEGLSPAVRAEMGDETQPKPIAGPEVLEKYGRRWIDAGPVPLGAWGDADVTWTSKLPLVRAWVNESNADNRMIVFNSQEDDVLWVKHVYEQSLIAGKWIKNGIARSEFRDGKVITSNNLLGEPHGVQESHDASGQMLHQMHFVNGKRHGIAKGWYPSGKPKDQSLYVDDVETEFKFWNEGETSSELQQTAESEKKTERKPSLVLQELKRSAIGDRIRLFDYRLTNETPSTLEDVQIEIECTTIDGKYLGSTKMLIDKLPPGESIIEKAMLEADVKSHELTQIRIIGDHRDKLELTFKP